MAESEFEKAARAEGWFDTGHRGHASGWPMFAKAGWHGNGFARDWEHLCRSQNVKIYSPTPQALTGEG